MSHAKRAVLLVGSPKGVARSTSSRRAAVLLDALQDRGWAASKVHLHAALRSQEGTEALLAAAASADLVILACPLYVDSLPAPVIRALELLHAARTRDGEATQFLTLMNCGFPEASHNDTALAICQLFARAMGWTWAGGIALGGTGMGVSGAAWYEVVRLTVDALERGEAVPNEAVALAGRPPTKTWLYMLAGNLMWRRQAKKNKVRRRLDARPYAGREQA